MYAAPMPGSGTDHTKQWSAHGGPVVVLVEPQLGENIGTAARAMANFGLTRLRLRGARRRGPMDRAKPVIGPAEAAAQMVPRLAGGETVAVVFGRERWGLENDEVGLADRIITFPINPAFASVNLAQAVLIVAYEWFKHAGAGALPFAMPQRSAAAGKEQLFAFFATLERELEKVEFFRPPEKRDTMTINLRNIF